MVYLRKSAVLALCTWVASALLRVGLGVIASLYCDRWPERLIATVTVFFISFPPFVIAVFLMILFSLWLRWLPLSSMINIVWRPQIRCLCGPTLGLGAPAPESNGVD